MANPARVKGTIGESDLVRWFHDRGYYAVDRNALHGARDIGDIHGVPGVDVISVKRPGRGKPMDLSGWLKELEAMRINAELRQNPGFGKPDGLLVVRRVGYPSPADWYAIQRLADWLEAREAHGPL